MAGTSRISKLLSGAAWLLGATSIVTLMGGAADAQACQTSLSLAGNSSMSSPTELGDVCDSTTLSVSSQDLPAYWEMTWEGSPSQLIYSRVNTSFSSYFGSFGTSLPFGAFDGDLGLYSSTDTLLASASYSDLPSGSFSGTTAAEINPSPLTPGTDYIIAIEGGSGTGPVTVDFSAVPEPSTIGLMGGGLALLGLMFGTRRKKA